MQRRLKSIFLHLCKWLGLFQLLSFAYRKRLQILCYHGFAYRDENDFSPGLFMHPEKFAQRMQWLARNGYRVLPLEEGIEKLQHGSLKPKSVVITSDDGFRSIGDLAVPIVEALNQPFTIYVTTYYMDKGTPIFRLAMQYMAWKAGNAGAKLGTLAAETIPAGWKSPKAGSDEPIWQLIDYAEAELTEDERVALCQVTGERLGVDYDDFSRAGLLSLMTEAEIRALAERGVDIQLHTHRHSLHQTAEQVRREIEENRQRLEPLVGKPLNHFCYPSGIWEPAHWEPLQALGIKSATTCDPGLNTTETPVLALNRFLDRDNISQIEFEAELSGFKEFARFLKRIFPGRRASEAKPITNYPDN